MPRITEELVRRRAEHNNCEITTLEELSLHQQEIERIEHLDRWCRNLKILYLQNNLIPKIENVSRLKQLEYLNLALNNVERIENLEGCEFLQKLDLTVNFVGDLLSVERLRANEHFRELYLTGNPCTDYEGYREFVVAALPGLQWLDGKEVSKSERILSTQKYEQLREKILVQQKVYEAKREIEKREHEEKQAAKADERRKKQEPGFDGRWYTDTDAHLKHSTSQSDGGEGNGEGRVNGQETVQPTTASDEDEKFWNEPTAFTPESRTEVHQYMAEKRKDKAKTSIKGLEPHKRVVRLERDGNILNVNEGRYDFNLKEEDENNRYVLEVAIPRFMSTSLVDCDVQPTYVRLSIRGKIFQLVLQEEVSPDRSSAQRSQTTGWLQLTLPKAREIVRAANPKTHSRENHSLYSECSRTTTTTTTTMTAKQSASGHTVGPTTDGDGGSGLMSESHTLQQQQQQQQQSRSAAVDIRNIVPRQDPAEESEAGSRLEAAGREMGGESQRTSSGRSLIQELDDGGSESDGGRETASSRERQSEESSDDSDVPPLI